MTKKHYYSWQDISDAANSITAQMFKDNYKPDFIIGLTRGGLPLAVMLSNKLDIPMKTLSVSFRDDTKTETDKKIISQAFGMFEPGGKKKILIVDDINDTGATFKWIVDDWTADERYEQSTDWKNIWNKTVRFAVITENLSSEFDMVRYSTHEVNKAEDDVWLVYPWEL